MSSRVSTQRKRSTKSSSSKKEPRRLRERHQITIDGRVWTLAKERFHNVSRLVENLLKLALNLEPSLYMVVVPDWERRGSLAREGGGLEIHWAFARRGSNPRPGANSRVNKKEKESQLYFFSVNLIINRFYRGGF